MIRKIADNHYFLMPGDFVVTKETIKIITIIGSCVSVCLYDPIKKIAGMNHYLLPRNTRDDTEILKYGDTSLDFMLQKMQIMGAEIKNIIAGVVGGSSIFSDQQHSFNIGRQNIDTALAFLKQKEIIVKLCETSGKIGRKVVFDTSSGNISSHLLKSR